VQEVDGADLRRELEVGLPLLVVHEVAWADLRREVLKAWTYNQGLVRIMPVRDPLEFILVLSRDIVPPDRALLVELLNLCFVTILCPTGLREDAIHSLCSSLPLLPVSKWIHY
jgi:hypothetical protein